MFLTTNHKLPTTCLAEARQRRTNYQLQPKSWYTNNSGFITLVSVLIVGIVGVAITVSLLLLGISSSKTSFVSEQSNQAKGLANACAEEALQQIRDSIPFTGSGNLTLGQGSCAYTVASQGGQDRTITVSSTVGTIVRKIYIVIDQINPTIQIVSWQEVADL